MTATVRIPRRFYDDHVERALEAPSVLVSGSRYYIIYAAPDDSAFQELLSDARYYAGGANHGFDMSDPVMRGLVASARATVRALEAAQECVNGS